ncbi:MAG: hypothetical protein LBI63_03220 [Candidatus Ancillula sp.]|jgi:hypothetical protein|nr:hypothetical protein [Candidatus Ancillula sp.]
MKKKQTLKQQKIMKDNAVSFNKLTQEQYTPDSASMTLQKYYLPILQQASPVPNQVPPVLLLGVKGGVGTTTVARLCADPSKVLDLSDITHIRQWVSYLPRVVLITNTTYSGVLALQGVMQQFTDRTQFEGSGFTPIVLGVVVVDNVNCKVTSAVKKFLDYVTSGVDRWNIDFVPSLMDVVDPNEAGITRGIWKEIEAIVAKATS